MPLHTDPYVVMAFSRSSDAVPLVLFQRQAACVMVEVSRQVRSRPMPKVGMAGSVPVVDPLQGLGRNRYDRLLRTAIFGLAQIQYIGPSTTPTSRKAKPLEGHEPFNRTRGHCMNLPKQRIQSVYQTWDLLMGLSRNADLPKSVRQEADRLLRSHLYAQKVHPILPDAPDTTGSEE